VAELLKLQWRDNASRIAIVITDAPPHGCGTPGDGFGGGCPCGIDLMAILHEASRRNIVVHVIGCESGMMDGYTRVILRGDLPDYSYEFLFCLY
jgi:hypothetical protein